MTGFDRDDPGTRPELLGWPCHVCRRRRTLVHGEACAVCTRQSAEWGKQPETEQEDAA